MPRDLRPGPDSPPADELQGAEDTLAVLQHVLHTIAAEDMSRQTPCVDFDVTRLTEHLLKSIAGIGGMADAQFVDTYSPAQRAEALQRALLLASPSSTR